MKIIINLYNTRTTGTRERIFDADTFTNIEIKNNKIILQHDNKDNTDTTVIPISCDDLVTIRSEI